MKWTAIVILAALVLGMASTGQAELSASEWNALRSKWNHEFRMSPPGDLMQNIQRGNFPEKVDEIASQQGAAVQKMIDDTVKEIERYLKAKAEGKIRVLEELRKADDPRALKLLATTMKLASGDILALKITEKEVAKDLERVKKSLVKTKQGFSGSAEVLHAKSKFEACLGLLPPFFTHSLNMKRAALLGFTGARGDKAASWLINDGLKDRDWEVRVGAAEALAEVDHPGAVGALEKALGDKDPAVRTASLSSLIVKEAKGSKKAILGALKDKNWEVQVAALEAVEALSFRDVETIDAVIQAMQDIEGRLRDDYDHLLTVLTGKSYYGDRELWKRWWTDNREKFVAREKGTGGDESPGEPAAAPPPPPPPAHKGAQGTASFYGIVTKSHNIIYVLDCSGSMAEKANLESLPGGAKGPVVTGKGGHRGPDPDPGDRPQGETRLDVLKWQLKKSIGMLPHKAMFNVIFYNHEFEVWQEKMVFATPANKKRVFEYIDKQTPQGRTNIFDPLEKAFEIAGSGPKMGGAGDPRYGSSMGGADTFFLLSDGSPNAGRIPDPPGILAEVRKINKLRKVVINTVVVGGGFNHQFMETLAKDNGGKTVVVK